MPDFLAETLDAVIVTKKATVAKIRNKLDPGHKKHPTAFNNRLDRLCDAGLLKRRKNGREYVYEAVEA